MVELRLHSPFLDLESFDVDLLGVKYLVLLILEFLKFESEPFLLRLFHSLTDALIAGNQLALFLLKLAFEVALVVSDALFCLHLNRFDLFLFLELEFVLERLQLGISRLLGMSSDFFLLIGLESLPLFTLFLDLALVLLNQLLLAQFKVTFDFIVALLILQIDLDLALFKLLFRLGLDQRVIQFGAKCWREPASHPVHVATVMDPAFFALLPQLLGLRFLELLAIYLVQRMVIECLTSLHILVVDLFVLVRICLPRFWDWCFQLQLSKLFRYLRLPQRCKTGHGLRPSPCLGTRRTRLFPVR